MTYAHKKFRLLKDFENHKAGEVFETDNIGRWWPKDQSDIFGPTYIGRSTLHAWLACGLIEEVTAEKWQPNLTFKTFENFNNRFTAEIVGEYETEAEAEAALERVKRALKGNLKPYDFDELGKSANKARDVEAENDKKFGKELK